MLLSVKQMKFVLLRSQKLKFMDLFWGRYINIKHACSSKAISFPNNFHCIKQSDADSSPSSLWFQKMPVIQLILAIKQKLYVIQNMLSVAFWLINQVLKSLFERGKNLSLVDNPFFGGERVKNSPLKW